MREEEIRLVWFGLKGLAVLIMTTSFFPQTGLAAKMDRQPQATVTPFLAIPLAEDGPRAISQGYEYSKDEISFHPEITRHFGIDFKAKWGTPVYAPADGLAVASYHTHYLDSPKKGSIGFGLGLFIQIWHEEAKLYSMYGHLAAIDETAIPYIPPTFNAQTQEWEPRQALYVPLGQFKKQAKPVKRGDLIGLIGYTGLFLDKENEASLIMKDSQKPPLFDPKKVKTWDPHGAHLHWEIYTRSADGLKKETRLDPFGIYAKREEYGSVFKKAQGLIIGNPDGTPLFAKPKRKRERERERE